jgi:hypothetical protein
MPCIVRTCIEQQIFGFSSRLCVFASKLLWQISGEALLIRER